MSDTAAEKEATEDQGQGQGQEPAPVDTEVTAGSLLRKARESARMQLPVLAGTLKVPLHKLEALEADNYAAFPDHVFMRALAMSMCRTLHIEAEPVMALLPHREFKSLANTGPGINETVKVRSNFKGAGTPVDSGNNGTRKIAAGVLVLLAAAAAVYFVPFHHAADGADEASMQSLEQIQPQPAGEGADVGDAAPSTAAAVEGSAGAGVGAGVGAMAEMAQEAAQTGATPANPAASVAPAQTPVPAISAATAAAEPAVAAEGGAAGLLVLKVNTGQSWVKIRDGAGKVVLEKTLNKDESVTAEGQLPLSVIVGNAKGTQVTVRGEPFDISATRDNVARFEVK